MEITILILCYIILGAAIEGERLVKKPWMIITWLPYYAYWIGYGLIWLLIESYKESKLWKRK